jgi:hypothetical protein
MEEQKKNTLHPRWKFGGVYRNFQLPEIPLIPYTKRKTPKYLKKYISKKIEICQEAVRENQCLE